MAATQPADLTLLARADINTKPFPRSKENPFMWVHRIASFKHLYGPLDPQNRRPHSLDIYYYEMVGTGDPPLDVGTEGDIYIRLAIPSRVYVRTSPDCWTEWGCSSLTTEPGVDVRSLLHHPKFGDRVLWCDREKGSIYWCYQRKAFGIAAATTPGQLREILAWSTRFEKYVSLFADDIRGVKRSFSETSDDESGYNSDDTSTTTKKARLDEEFSLHELASYVGNLRPGEIGALRARARELLVLRLENARMKDILHQQGATAASLQEKNAALEAANKANEAKLATANAKAQQLEERLKDYGHCQSLKTELSKAQLGEKKAVADNKRLTERCTKFARLEPINKDLRQKLSNVEMDLRQARRELSAKDGAVVQACQARPLPQTAVPFVQRAQSPGSSPLFSAPPSEAGDVGLLQDVEMAAEAEERINTHLPELAPHTREFVKQQILYDNHALKDKRSTCALIEETLARLRAAEAEREKAQQGERSWVGKCSAVEEVLASVVGQRDDLQNRVCALEADAKKQEGYLANLRLELSSTQARADERAETIAGEIEEKAAQLANLRKERETLLARLQQSDDLVRATERDFQAASEKNEHWKHKHAAVCKEVRRLAEDLAQLQAEVERITREKDLVVVENQRLREDVAAMNTISSKWSRLSTAGAM